MRRSIAVLALCFCLLLTLPLAAQTTTGTISGTVLDPQGAVIPGASVTATNVAQNAATKATTDSIGKFVFTNMLPSTYTITVTKSGFRTYSVSNIVLTGMASISVPNISLEVASANTETVEVVAQGDTIQTETASRGTTIVATQLANIQNNGRNFLGYLRLVPGMYSNLDTTKNTNQTGDMNMNGSRAAQANITINGASDVDTGSNTKMMVTVNPDTIQEFTVLSNSYDAQYGKSGGAQVSVVTKSGTTSFHGMGYEYFRDRSLNANSWDNKRKLSWLPSNATDAQKYAFRDPQYHYTSTGYNFGGPIFIPKKFNKDKSKLFFFWSDEYQHQVFPSGNHNVTMPTALERAGDFSQSLDARYATPTSGQYLYPGAFIKDPSSPLGCSYNNSNPAASVTAGCFQGLKNGVATLGVIPSSAIFAPSQALLNFLPLPNNPAGGNQYNYTSSLPQTNPRHEQLLRVDYNISSKWRLNGTWANLAKDVVTDPYNPSGYSYVTNFPIKGTSGVYNHPGHIYTANLATTINDKTINELIFDIATHPVQVLPTNPDAVTVAGTGINLPVLSSIKVLGNQYWIPAFQFGGGPVANSPSVNPNSGAGSWTPYDGFNTTIELADNFSRMQGKHFLRFGVFMQRSRKDQPAYNYPSGYYNFGQSSSNPYDSNNGFANSLLGVYQQYMQSSSYVQGAWRYTNFESYAQDSWRLTRRLTLNVGLRVYYLQPTYEQNANASNFLPSTWSLANAQHIYKPGAGSSQLIDSVTGNNVTASCAGMFPLQTASQAYNLCVGKLIPGIGSSMDGLIHPGSVLPNGSNQNVYLMKAPPLSFAPRFGLAYDVTGKGNIVFRMGAGAFPDRYQGNNIFNPGLIGNPPTNSTVTLYNGMAQNIAQAGASGLSAPLNINGVAYNDVTPIVYNWNSGIQARLPKAFTADISYVGGTSRHLIQGYNVNGIPFGGAFLPANQDPTKGVPYSGLPGHTAYSSTYIRPMQGMDNINMLDFGGTSNYNALQAQLSRRFASGLFLSASYVYSRCMDTQDADGGANPVFPDHSMERAYAYGPCGFDVRQNFTASYVYPLPKFSKMMGWTNNGVGSRVLDGWTISGVTTFRNGNPTTVNMGSVTGTDGVQNYTGTGSMIGTLRAVLVGDPFAGTGSNPYNRLNATAYTQQPVATKNADGTWNYTLGFGCLNSSNCAGYQERNQIITPGVNNFDLTLQKNVPIKEAMQLQFRVEAFNAFNHTQFSGLNTTLNYTGYGVNTQQSSNIAAPNSNQSGGFGSVSGARPARVVQLTAKFVF